jgi:hypothetical protein
MCAAAAVIGSKAARQQGSKAASLAELDDDLLTGFRSSMRQHGGYGKTLPGS